MYRDTTVSDEIRGQGWQRGETTPASGRQGVSRRCTRRHHESRVLATHENAAGDSSEPARREFASILATRFSTSNGYRLCLIWLVRLDEVFDHAGKRHRRLSAFGQ